MMTRGNPVGDKDAVWVEMRTDVRHVGLGRGLGHEEAGWHCVTRVQCNMGDEPQTFRLGVAFTKEEVAEMDKDKLANALVQCMKGGVRKIAYELDLYEEMVEGDLG